MKTKKSEKKEKIHLSFESENLAFPEIHTGTVEDEIKPEETVPAPAEELSVQYDTVAIPEVHTGKED